MRSASFQIESDRPRASLRRRGSAFFLALVVELLIVLALITVAWRPPSLPKPKPEPNTFTLTPPPPPKEKLVIAKSSRKGGHARSDVVEVRPPPPLVPPVLSKPSPPLLNDKELFDAADISKMHSDTGAGKGNVYGPGEGPGGEQLFNAEWYREPSDGELAHYLPPRVELGSWAEIACKTIPDFHVENCRALGESPVGSGLARALRLAAWQFRVRPPRIGGKPIMGAWVRIHFDFSRERKKKDEPRPQPEDDPQPQPDQQ
jgi:protein TonB